MAMEMFTALRTQWRLVGTPWGLHYEGLDYTALPAVEAILGVKTDRATLEQLHVLEREARTILNEPHEE